jgi:hypothetical protein
LLISNVFRFDTSGNLLPFRPATVGLDGRNFNLLEPPNAPFDMACFGGWYPDAAQWRLDGGTSPWGWESLEMTPQSMVSWTLLAMALALLLGVTIRRVRPAMIAFAVTFIDLAV